MVALEFILRTLLELYTMTFLLRFLLQWTRADYANPLSQFIVQVTNPLVRPLRRFVPGWGGIDTSTLIVAYLLVFATTLVSIFLLTGRPPGNFLALAVVSLIDLILLQLRLFIYLIIGFVLLSWFAPYHPIGGVLRSLSAPLLRPFQRLLPDIGGFDLSPLFATIVIYALVLLVETNKPGLYALFV